MGRGVMFAKDKFSRFQYLLGRKVNMQKRQNPLTIKNRTGPEIVYSLFATHFSVWHLGASLPPPSVTRFSNSVAYIIEKIYCLTIQL